MSELAAEPMPFNGQCIVCDGSIKKGEMAIFDKGKGNWHVKCYTINSPESPSTKISTDYPSSGYENKSNDLIAKLTLEGNTEQKLSKFEANSPESTTKTIESKSLSRNPELASLMKIRHNHTCQVCEIPTFKNKNGNYHYTESHHIIPRALGGPDKPSNILIVCANCHRKFDSGDESTLLETYRILKQNNIIKNFDSLRKYDAISENLVNQLSNLN